MYYDKIGNNEISLLKIFRKEMSKMKKNKIITNFLIGGCVGRTLMELCSIIATFFTKNDINNALADLKVLLIIFIISGIGFNIAILSVKKIEQKDMKSKDRQQLLKRQMYITASAILFFSLFLIIYTIKNNYIGIILALSFCAVFSFWGYAFLLSYINLKNSMAMITKKNNKMD